MEPRAQWSIVCGGVLLLCTICSGGPAGAMQPDTKDVPGPREVLAPASPGSELRLQPSAGHGMPHSNDMSSTKGAQLVIMSPADFGPEGDAPSTAGTVRNARLLTAEDIAGKELEYLAVPDSDVIVLQMAAIVSQPSAQPMATQPPTTTTSKVREATGAPMTTLTAGTATTAKATMTTTKAITTTAKATMTTAKVTTTPAAPVKLVRPQQEEKVQPMPQPMSSHQRLQTMPTAAPVVSTSHSPMELRPPVLVQVREEKRLKAAAPQQMLRPQQSPAVPKQPASLKAQAQPDKRANSKRSPLLEQLKAEAVAGDGDVIALLPRGFQLPIPAEDEQVDEEARGGNGVAAELGQGYGEALPADNYGHNGQESDEEYQFSYSVNDEEHGTMFGQSESRAAGRTTGRYWQRLPDGRHQAVSYWADDVSGYRAHVHYSDQPDEPEHQ